MRIPAVNFFGSTAGNQTKCLYKLIFILTIGLMGMFILGVSAKAQSAITVRTVTVEQTIPFETTYIDLPNQYKGYTKLVSEGVMGATKLQAQVAYQNDKMVKVLSIQAVETGAPVNQVVQRGTKVLKSRTADGSRWQFSFAHPLKNKGWLSADFYDYPGHNGIDFAAPYGTPVYAAAEGTVILSGWYGEYGRCVILQHSDGSQTVYAHNSSLSVKVGQHVLQGELIAKVGSTGNSTGNHLHFELRVNGTFLNPLLYIDQ